jgi:hypothetical protein
MKKETEYLGLVLVHAFLGVIRSILDVLAEIVIYKFEGNLNAGFVATKSL